MARRLRRLARSTGCLVIALALVFGLQVAVAAGLYQTAYHFSDVSYRCWDDVVESKRMAWGVVPLTGWRKENATCDGDVVPEPTPLAIQ